MSIILFTGDDPTIPASLELNGSSIAINSTATIQASIVSINGSKVLIPPVTVHESETGSDWANGLIVIRFTSTETDLIKQPMIAELEVQVDDSGKQTWSKKIEIKLGTIDQ